MARISQIDLETASPEIKAIVKEHVESGHKITNVKRTILHHLPSFKALELGQYDVDDDLQRIIGKLDGDIFEFAISNKNGCLVCSNYFIKLLKIDHGIEDPFTYEFTKRQALLIQYAEALVQDPKNVPDELFAQLQEEFDEETIIAITTMGVMLIAMNNFNDALQIEPE